MAYADGRSPGPVNDCLTVVMADPSKYNLPGLMGADANTYAVLPEPWDSLLPADWRPPASAPPGGGTTQHQGMNLLNRYVQASKNVDAHAAATGTTQSPTERRELLTSILAGDGMKAVKPATASEKRQLGIDN